MLSKSALAAIFKRNGASGDHTRLYEDMRVEDRLVIESALDGVDVSGSPVVVSIFSPQDWSLIGTSTVIVSEHGHVIITPIVSIVRVQPRRKVNGIPIKKPLWTTLEVSRSDGIIVALRTDPGQPFVGVWNLLKTFEASARREPDPKAQGS